MISAPHMADRNASVEIERVEVVFERSARTIADVIDILKQNSLIRHETLSNTFMPAKLHLWLQDFRNLNVLPVCFVPRRPFARKMLFSAVNQF